MAGNTRIGRSVRHAEERTALQFCVYLGHAGETDARTHALSLFHRATPDVLLVVAPDQRQVEIVTADGIRHRVTDAACTEAIAIMRPLLRRGHYEWAIVAGLDHLSMVAGPGQARPGAVELPNVVDESGEVRTVRE